jgi:serine/threonine protein phosphatase 1
MPPHPLPSPQRHSPQHHWIIGDVHGCADALAALVALLPREDRLVFCGDVINRGPRIEAAMEFAWDLVQAGRAIWLMGNHERALVDGLASAELSALASLAGCDTYRQLGDRRARLWLERLRQLPLAYWGQGWVATHAGFDPITWQPDLSVRMAFWQAYDGRFGDAIVGHTPGPDVRHLGRVVLIDTGACYGGHLTAYCAETGQVRRVPGLAQRPGPIPVLPLRPGGLLP